MKSHVRVLIIGGGIIGVSTLYHLTKMGWDDVALVERGELCSGQTWHAAGLCAHFNGIQNIVKMQRYSIALYHTLEEETGQPVGFHRTGSLRLATTPDRMDEFRRFVGIARAANLELTLIGPDEIKAHYPFVELDGVLGALHDTEDGSIDPSSVTQAMAKGARNGGAEVYRHNPVSAISRTPGGEWEVTTREGTITAEIIVNAAGFRANQVAAMVGYFQPIVTMEHQYVVTEDLPELEACEGELAVLREVDKSYYLKQEGKGLMLGPYEPDATPRWITDVPETFNQDLLPPNLERIQDIFEAAIRRVPILGNAGIKTILNGPMTFSADGNPQMGPVYGIPNCFNANGFSYGIVQGGGAGRFMAQWIIEGEPEIDLWDVDSRRFGAYANERYSVDKVKETYRMEFAVGYPFEERPAARPAKTSPLYRRLAERGAVFGCRYGWERANWFAPGGVMAKDVESFHRTNWFEPIGNECRAVRERVGVLDLSAFSKFEVSGPGAEAFLDRVMANRAPRRAGGITLAHMLTRSGGIACEFTITRLSEDRFYLVSATAAERHDHDWLRNALPTDGSVTVENITNRWGTLVLAGPRSRDVLARLTDADLSNESFKWLTAREIQVGYAPVRALRVNYMGELGWELHTFIEHIAPLYDAVIEVGAEFGIADFGMRAMESLRMEKAYRMWGADLTTEYTPLEAGLERFVKFDKGDFTGRDALVRQRDGGLTWTLVCLTVEVDDSDAIGKEPVLKDGEVIGVATSGAYGFSVEKSLALAYVKPEFATPGTTLEVEILAERYPALVVEAPLYDPENSRLRG